METYDYLIVGAGIVGLTVAWELKRRDSAARILILEKEPDVGYHASGRNSGVLHSGIYYAADTLKAKYCAKGAARMREFAAEHGIHCERSGKVIIATSQQELPTLERLLKNARDNGIRAEKLDAGGIRQIEPHAYAYEAGIYSPDTAVIDSPGVVAKLRDLLRGQGVTLRFNAAVNAVDTGQKTVDANQHRYGYGYLFNCAGASADRVARFFNAGAQYALLPFKGLYYKLRPERGDLVKSSIYPVPDINLPFLGVHLTRVISGDVYVGPTAIPAWGRENYGVLSGLHLGESMNIAWRLMQMYAANHQHFRDLVHAEMAKYSKANFLAAARKLVPEVRADDLLPCNKVGIRPQLVNLQQKRLEMDFVLEQTADSLHVLNSISPAFTCSFAFAESIVDQHQKKAAA
ncbi:MAG: L-2-hydroxyglutarate oxidase [Hydrogenophilales bacterium]|nr:L-2-hydroxyglutarate oxidase [Hydrogenophilales bacterium]